MDRTQVGRLNEPAGPPGRTKLIIALRQLLEERDFHSITTAEIASTAATNEALIYRYFGDKRGLLHEVLAWYMEEALQQIKAACEDISDPVERLKHLIWFTLDTYNRHRVFAKVVYIEARCCKKYFESQAYQLVGNYSELFVDVINEAVKTGQFRGDIGSARIRDAILGMVEQVIIPAVVFGKDVNPEASTKAICGIIFDGIATRRREADSPGWAPPKNLTPIHAK